ncbi:MAG: TonB-dependent receptor [bacterium]
MKLNFQSLLLIAYLTFGTLIAQDRKGQITGQVIDARTQEPLPGVNVVLVEKTRIGAVTDIQGNFSLKEIEVGEYALRFSIIGYESVIVTNVVVSTGRSAKVSIKMQETTLQMEGQEVRADYFQRAGSMSPISTTGLDAAEIRRSPGSVQDIQRIVQNLPGVGNSTDQTNELIVRGGAPNENLTVMDYLEIPSTNHYPNQFNSGGPINMINADLIQDIQFSTGGYPANYGDKLSSVMNVAVREGDRDRRIASNTSMHFAGVGAVLEGGIASGRGSWIISARQSFLEVLDKLVGVSSLGLTAVPKYWDAQWKVVYDLSPQHKLLFNGLLGDDRILMVGSEKEHNAAKAGVRDSVNVNDIDFHSSQYAVGITLKSILGTVGYSALTLYSWGNFWDMGMRSKFSSRSYDAEGNLGSVQTISDRTSFYEYSQERYLGLKYEAVYGITKAHNLAFGAQYQTVALFKNDVKIDRDTVRYNLDGLPGFEIPMVVVPPWNLSKSISFARDYKLDAYVSNTWQVSPVVIVTGGLRYDYFSYSRCATLSPRLNCSYHLYPPTTKLTAAYGEYYQIQSFPTYGDPQDLEFNRYLKNSHARHLVFGIEHILAEGLKLSLEGYQKSYSDLPVRQAYIYSADRTFRSDTVLNLGIRSAYGIEFFMQQKQVTNTYFTLSYSWSKTRDKDPRTPKLVEEYPSAYDYPHIFTFVIGHRVKDFRTTLNNLPFYIKYPSSILPFSDDMEISLRFRFQSGNVYTPRVYVTDEQHRVGGRAWTPGWWKDGVATNSARYPDYHRLDIQWISRYHLAAYNIEVVFAIQNVYNRANISMMNYRSDGTIENVYQFSFFPVAGLNVEF